MPRLAMTMSLRRRETKKSIGRGASPIMKDTGGRLTFHPSRTPSRKAQLSSMADKGTVQRSGVECRYHRTDGRIHAPRGHPPCLTRTGARLGQDHLMMLGLVRDRDQVFDLLIGCLANARHHGQLGCGAEHPILSAIVNDTSGQNLANAGKRLK